MQATQEQYDSFKLKKFSYKFQVLIACTYRNFFYGCMIGKPQPSETKG